MKTFIYTITYLISTICFLTLLEVDFATLPWWKIILSAVPFLIMIKTFDLAWPTTNKEI